MGAWRRRDSNGSRSEMRAAVLLGAVAFAIGGSGCDFYKCGFKGTVEVPQLDGAFSGKVTSPAMLALPSTIPSNGGLDPSSGGAESNECPETFNCLTTPTQCVTTCFKFRVGGATPTSNVLIVSFAGFDPRAAPSLALPDPGVTVKAELSANDGFGPTVPLTLTGGSFSAHLTKGQLDAEFSLDLVTGAGDSVTIENGRNVVHQSSETECYED
jgi:hypothetical protein